MKQQFKNELLTQKKCINSILRFYKLADLSELTEGLRWYNDANIYSKELADRFELKLNQVVGIIAAFSPQTGWSENKRFALSFLLNPTVKTKSLAQYTKAKKILNITNESAIYNALSTNGKAFKTKAFFLNILNPDIDTGVTIDRHAIACCIQSTDNVYALEDSYGKLTKKQYEFFQQCYIKAANKLEIFPHQLQAIVWLVYRRLRELKNHDTSEDWKPFKTSVSF